MEQRQEQQVRASAIRVSLACVQCRSRHLRCDATQPVCGRCLRDGTTCVYLKSRRGGNRRRNTIRPLAIGQSHRQSTNSQYTINATIDSGLDSQLPETYAAQTAAGDSAPINSLTASSGDLDFTLNDITEIVDTYSQRDCLLGFYYTYFHVAHPCVIPESFVKERLTASGSRPGTAFLILVMEFIGSLYCTDTPSQPLETQIQWELAQGTTHWKAYHVLAVLLYAIAVYWNNEIKRGRELLNLAIEKALELEMHLKQFAVNNSGGDCVVAECLRRTWWELYLCDAAMTSADHSNIFKLSRRNVQPTADLPCEESEYDSGVRTSRFDISFTNPYRSFRFPRHWTNITIGSLRMVMKLNSPHMVI
jgi:Fungal Zn(2)-Cys(6) binuclear cluster domain/Fungal specific transcription factor domain